MYVEVGVTDKDGTGDRELQRIQASAGVWRVASADSITISSSSPLFSSSTPFISSSTRFENPKAERLVVGSGGEEVGDGGMPCNIVDDGGVGRV